MKVAGLDRDGKRLEMVTKARPKVVVLGGGFGGLESTFYLRKKVGD